MTRDDDAREIEDSTTTAGGQQAWSAVGPQGEPQTPLAGDPPPEGFAGPWRSPSDGRQPGDTDRPGGPDRPGDPWDEDRRQWDSPERGGRNWDEQEWDERDQGGQDADADRRLPAGTGPGGDGPAELTSGHESSNIVDEEKPPPGPVLVAAGLGLLTKAGWVFQNIDLTLRPGSVAAIVGPAGTGRSCLLLALTGRMAANTGRLMVAGHLIEDAQAHIRALTSVARIGSIIVPEPGLTVRESIDERCLLDNVDAKIGRTRFGDACNAMRVTFDPSALVGTLVGEQATLFAVALACVRVSAVIVLDDLDRGVSAAMQQTVLDALIRLAKTGPTIIVSTTDRIPVMEAEVVLDLTPEEGRALWQLAPPEGPPAAILRRLDPADQQRDPRPQLDSGQFRSAAPDTETDPDAPTQQYRPDSGRYWPEPDRDPTDSDPTNSDPTNSDRPDGPGTQAADAATEDNR